MTFLRFSALALGVGCANSGDPPGGPPDTTPPTVTRIEPDSGAVLATPPSEASIVFDEVISERTTATTNDIAGAVILSPTSGPERVSWRRDRISVRPRRGFQAGRIYRLELLPVITDLRNNRMRAGRTVVFSTGPAIPDTRIEGTVVDWVGGRPAARALIEAALMPDSLVYRTLTDSGGVFRMTQIPAGHYRVYGIMDSNNDRRRGTREAYDTAAVDLDSSVTPLELYAFTHDTTGPRLRQVEVTDSVTLKLTFDRPLDPTLVLDTPAVTVATLEDSTTALPLVGVFTAKGIDSLKARTADSVQAAHAAADSLRAAADTTRRVRPDTTRRVRPDTTRRVRPDTTRRLRPDSTRRAPLDSTRAERMLARRPSPTDVRVIKLLTPLAPDTRYVVYVRGARSLSGNSNNARGQVRAFKPAPQRTRSPADSTAAARDTTTVPRDTTRAPATPRDTTRLPPTPRDTTRPPGRP